MCLDICEWYTESEWKRARSYFWLWIATVSLPCWFFGLALIRIMEKAPVSWSPWSGLTLERAPVKDGKFNIETTAAANVELWQSDAHIDIEFAFDSLSLALALLRTCMVAVYICILLAIKFLTLLATKPWVLAFIGTSFVCSHVWLQDAEFQNEGAENQNNIQMLEN
jgi:hypothetical protein